MDKSISENPLSCAPIPLTRTSRICLSVLAIGLLFMPFALVVNLFFAEGATVNPAQIFLLLLLLGPPVWCLRHLRLFKSPQQEPTLYE